MKSSLEVRGGRQKSRKASVLLAGKGERTDLSMLEGYL
jgi:hypothetical protein